MLWNASAINGYAIAASDGPLGTVSDFLFDDASWLVRWLVVDTGYWLAGRKVLLPPSVLGQLDPKKTKFSVTLTMQQVKDSPDIASGPAGVAADGDRHLRLLRLEPRIGAAAFTWAATAICPAAWPRCLTWERSGSRRRSPTPSATDDDPHLRSINAVTGYHIHAKDGEIGHVEDFLVEDADWSIHYLVVDTKNWWPGKKVLVSPRSVLEIDWTDKLVNLDLDRQRIKDSPAYDALTTVDQAYEESLLKYYGITWVAPSERHPDRAPVA